MNRNVRMSLSTASLVGVLYCPVSVSGAEETFAQRSRRIADICGVVSSVEDWKVETRPPSAPPTRVTRLVGPEETTVAFSSQGSFLSVRIDKRDNTRRRKRDVPRVAAFSSEAEIVNRAKSVIDRLDEAKRTWTLDRVTGTPRQEGQDPGDIHGKASARFVVYHQGYKVITQAAVVNFDGETGDVLYVATIPSMPIDPPVIRKTKQEAGAIIIGLVESGQLDVGNSAAKDYYLDLLRKKTWAGLRLQYYADGKHHSPPRTRLCYDYAGNSMHVVIDAETGAVLTSGMSKAAGVSKASLRNYEHPLAGENPSQQRIMPSQSEKESSPIRPKAIWTKEPTGPANSVAVSAAIGATLFLFGGVWWWARRH